MGFERGRGKGGEGRSKRTCIESRLNICTRPCMSAEASHWPSGLGTRWFTVAVIELPAVVVFVSVSVTGEGEGEVGGSCIVSSSSPLWLPS